LQCIPVSFSDYPVQPAYVQQLQRLGIQILACSRWFNLVAADLNEQQLKIVKQLPFVASIEPYRRKLNSIPAITQPAEAFTPDYAGLPSFREQLRITHTDVLNANRYRGQGKVIALMDDGFMNVNRIPAFRHLFTNKQVLATFDFVDGDTDVYNNGNHGTLVLSNIAAILPDQIYGGAYDARFILCRTENNTSESRQEELNWLMAAEFADSSGADIFSTSLGYSNGMSDSTENYTYADMDGNTTLITKAADMAASKGILVINSAGNEGSSAWHYITAPGDADSVLTVGAVDRKGVRSAFSSVGPTADGRIKPELATLGSRNFAIGTNGLVYRVSGTSFSCPLMSALAASLWSSSPNETAWKIRETLIQSGHQYSQPDTFLGYGIPDARKAFFLLHGYYLTEPVDSAELSRPGTGIFPNPAYDKIRIVIENRYAQPWIRIMIHDVCGRLIKEGSYPLVTDYNERYLDLQISGMPSGIYYVSLSSEQQQALGKHKLVVQSYQKR
jgi:serine protease AprX